MTAWSTDYDGEEVFIMTFSSAGVQPIEEKLQWLAGRLQLCMEESLPSEKSVLLVSQQDRAGPQLLLSRCTSTRKTSCEEICSLSVA